MKKFFIKISYILDKFVKKDLITCLNFSKKLLEKGKIKEDFEIILLYLENIKRVDENYLKNKIAGNILAILKNIDNNLVIKKDINYLKNEIEKLKGLKLSKNNDMGVYYIEKMPVKTFWNLNCSNEIKEYISMLYILINEEKK